MFGRSFFSDFRDDPFFAGFNNQFREMDSFFSGGRDDFPALPEGRSRDRQVAEKNQRHNEVAPFGFGANPFDFGGIFGGFGQMFNDLHRQMEQSRNDPNAFSYSQSSVMSFSNMGDGEPKIYQATTSTRQAPGGVRETKKAVRDSTTGIQRMEVGHHIGNRGKVVEREIDLKTGQRNERSDLIGMREGEDAVFAEEWRRRTRAAAQPAIVEEEFHRPALTDGRSTDRQEKKAKKSRKHEYYVEEAQAGRYDRFDNCISVISDTYLTFVVF